MSTALLDISWVTDWLAVGARPDDERRADLQALGITHIIDVSGEEGHALSRADSPFTVLRLPTTDPPEGNVKPTSYWWAGIAFALAAVRQEGGKVLVHCVYGSNRGPTMALAILEALSPGISWERTIRQVRPMAELKHYVPQALAAAAEWRAA